MLEAYSVGTRAQVMEDQEDKEIVQDVFKGIQTAFLTKIVRGCLRKFYIS